MRGSSFLISQGGRSIMRGSSFLISQGGWSIMRGPSFLDTSDSEKGVGWVGVAERCVCASWGGGTKDAYIQT